MAALVLWICLWPLACIIYEYFYIKTKVIKGETVKDNYDVSSILVVWIVVGIILYNQI